MYSPIYDSLYTLYMYFFEERKQTLLFLNNIINTDYNRHYIVVRDFYEKKILPLLAVDNNNTLTKTNVENIIKIIADQQSTNYANFFLNNKNIIFGKLKFSCNVNLLTDTNHLIGLFQAIKTQMDEYYLNLSLKIYEFPFYFLNNCNILEYVYKVLIDSLVLNVGEKVQVTLEKIRYLNTIAIVVNKQIILFIDKLFLNGPNVVAPLADELQPFAQLYVGFFDESMYTAEHISLNNYPLVKMIIDLLCSNRHLKNLIYITNNQSLIHLNSVLSVECIENVLINKINIEDDGVSRRFKLYSMINQICDKEIIHVRLLINHDKFNETYFLKYGFFNQYNSVVQLIHPIGCCCGGGDDNDDLEFITNRLNKINLTVKEYFLKKPLQSYYCLVEFNDALCIYKISNIAERLPSPLWQENFLQMPNIYYCYSDIVAAMDGYKFGLYSYFINNLGLVTFNHRRIWIDSAHQELANFSELLLQPSGSGHRKFFCTNTRELQKFLIKKFHLNARESRTVIQKHIYKCSIYFSLNEYEFNKNNETFNCFLLAAAPSDGNKQEFVKFYKYIQQLFLVNEKCLINYINKMDILNYLQVFL